MKIINSTCPDEALLHGIALLTKEGIFEKTRNGAALVMPYPVMTVNKRPMQRVSVNPKRNANPFFHLMESLWMLAGRNDSDFLNEFVGDFGKRYAEEDGHLHGAYGFRWRRHFDIEGGGENGPVDQLGTVVHMLVANPDDRRVVISMWDPMADLAADKKDIPCNTHIYPRVRGGDTYDHAFLGNIPDPAAPPRVLDLTVCCRSNDAVWGAHGANVVHFSVLQEYLAAKIGVGVGTLYQLSNNYHVYEDALNKIWPASPEGTDFYRHPVTPTSIVTHAFGIDADLDNFFGAAWHCTVYANEFFNKVAVPMRKSYNLWRQKDTLGARNALVDAIVCDWTLAAAAWYQRALEKRGEL
jgi:thymidylate synthase